VQFHDRRGNVRTFEFHWKSAGFDNGGKNIVPVFAATFIYGIIKP
jgi:hypothetical protein